MNHPNFEDLNLDIAWEFTELIPGSFERNREKTGSKTFPIIGPRPTHGAKTQPKMCASATRPFLYVVYDANGVIKYVGSATASNLKTVLERWIRPSRGNSEHYWSHGSTSKNSKATIEHMAEGFVSGKGPYILYFSNYQKLFPLVKKHGVEKGISATALDSLLKEDFIIQLEKCFIFFFQPEWNSQHKKKKPICMLTECWDYWR